ncbi:hypothetical protein PTTG_25234 [Puccinia triticina 1-1 BBBD Race 1]|uniref:CCHC-type domain-containing protein n=1 Tax=Puccinia triticina (isolate 1-1 / race 1 (BBBD)) TaxID=630390 RepID=A0A180H3Q0_PUCT1|nr:hypothetical protein PTTG_25234 [Puccinia triticina 1-1 BBBD Race 1]
MPYRTLNNACSLIVSVPFLDENLTTFPSWRLRLEEVLKIQNIHDIVIGKVVRPGPDVEHVRTSEEGYNPEESIADWDRLSDVACSTIRLTLAIDMAMRYQEIKPARTLFTMICDMYDRSIADRLLRIEDSLRKTTGRIRCWNCGHPGHHLSNCNQPGLKKKPKSFTVPSPPCPTLTAPVDNSNPNEDSSFDDETNVVWT